MAQFMNTGHMQVITHKVIVYVPRTRQIQNVQAGGSDGCISSDHTFATAKNFRKEIGIPNPDKEMQSLICQVSNLIWIW